jgi:hypothetical protein
MAPIETQLVELEKEYWKAVQDRDVDKAMELTAFPCLVTNPRGVRWADKEALAAMMRHGRYGIDRVDLRDPQVHFLGEHVAIIAYLVHEELIIDGKLVRVDAADSSTWVRKNGHWLCAAHSEALTGDPFGRDRIALA